MNNRTMLSASNGSLLFLQYGPDTVYRNTCLLYAARLFLLALLQVFLLTAPAHATTTSSFTVTRAYGAPLSIAEATAQVQTEAQLQAHADLLRKLVQEPAIQHINTVTATFSPPDINGLIYYLYDFPFTYSVDPMTKSITGSVAPVPRFASLREAVIAALNQRALMEHYGALVAAQKHALHVLKRSLDELEEQKKQEEQATNDPRSSEVTVATTPDHADTPPNALSLTPTAQAVQTVQVNQAIHATQATNLAVLQKYQDLLHDYAYTDMQAQDYTQAHDPLWSDPETVYARLSELATISPHQPLIQGALAEVLLQLKKPLQAQLHSDRALNLPQPLHPNETAGQGNKPDQSKTPGKGAPSSQKGKQNKGETSSQNATANNRPKDRVNDRVNGRVKERTSDILGEYAYLYDTRGEIFLQLNLPTLATENFTKAIELDGHNPLFFLHRAASYLPRNKTAAMCHDFSQACILGDCSGYQWAVEQQLCVQESPAQESPAQESPVQESPVQESPAQGLLQTPLAQVPKP